MNIRLLRKKIIIVSYLLCVGFLTFILYDYSRPTYWLIIPLQGEIPLYNHLGTQKNVSIIGIERALRKAAKDRKLNGVIFDVAMRLTDCINQPADLEAIVYAIKKFKRSGKKVICYTKAHEDLPRLNDTCQLFGGGYHDRVASFGDMFIASFADDKYHKTGGKIYLNPIPDLEMYWEPQDQKQESWVSFGSHVSIPEKTLAKMGIRNRKFSLGRYKEDYNTFLKAKINQIGWLLSASGIKDLLTGDETITITLQEAMEIGLIDHIVYNIPTEGKNTIDYWTYTKLLPKLSARLPRYKALIVDISSQIQGGYTFNNMLSSERVLGRIDKYDLVVFLLNTPGGSADIAYLYKEKIEYLLSKGVPVYAIARNRCVSGGQWILSLTDDSMSYRTSMMGSVGVIGPASVMDFSEVLAKIGISPKDTVGEVLEVVEKGGMLSDGFTLRDLLKSLGLDNKDIAYITKDEDDFPFFVYNPFAFYQNTRGIPLSILDKPLKKFLSRCKNQKIKDILASIVGGVCFFSKEQRYEMEGKLQRTYDDFIDVVTTKNELDREDFVEYYGDGRVMPAYMAEDVYVDKYIEEPLIDVFEKLTKKYNMGRCFYDLRSV